MDKVKFPAPNCTMGYSWDYLEEIMPIHVFEDFRHWMRGQTCCICEGRSYSHEDKQYYPDECAATPHGGVAYTWDVQRFLGLVPGREIWD